MKEIQHQHSEEDLYRNFRAVLSYYEKTVWKHVKNIQLSGAQYAVADLAWHRLYNTFAELTKKAPEKFQKEQKTVESYRPNPLVREPGITPESLANVAAIRLASAKPTSREAAIEEAHKLIFESRKYIENLPAKSSDADSMLDAYLIAQVSFKDIIRSFNKPDSFPLLPTVQANRNAGILTATALEQAIRRFADKIPEGSISDEKIREESFLSIKGKEITCRLLEKIRWCRFLGHYKP